MRLDYSEMPEELDSLNRERYRLTLEKMKLEGKFRDRDFLLKLHRKGKLIFLEGILPTDFNRGIRNIIEALDEKYEDNWDFHLEPYLYRDKVHYQLFFSTIYKELTITSEDGNSHLIRDLIVSFGIRNYDGKMTIGEPYGTRATLTEAEAISNYRHSHLNTDSLNRRNILCNRSFCLGSATPMSELLADSREENYEFTKEYFELLLYTMDSVVEWESVSGTPFMRIRDIAMPGVNYCDESPYLIKSGYLTLNVRTSLSPYLSKINYRFLNGRVTIVDDNTFQESLKEIILDKGEHLVKYLVGKRKQSNRYVSIDLSGTEHNSNVGVRFPELYFIFRGEKINFKVISSRETDSEPDLQKIIDNSIVLPKFKDYVKKELEEELYKKAVRREAIIREQCENSDA